MKTFTPKGQMVGMIMPSFIMKTKLSLGAKLVYALLCDYAGKQDHCWPSQLKLSQKLCCSISSVKRYLAELVRAKFVHIQHNSQKSSVYFMLDNPIRHEVKLNCQNLKNESKLNLIDEVKLSYQKPFHEVKLNCHEVTLSYQKPFHEVKLNCQQSKLDYESNLNNLLRNTPPISPTKDFEKKEQKGCEYIFENINTDFETFWQKYPKHEVKDSAKSLWHSMAKANELPELSVLHLALQYFCKTESWQRENKRYVPQLVNWLKNKRWQDVSPQELESLARELAQTKAILTMKPSFQTNNGANNDNAELTKLKVLFELFAANFTISSQGIKSMAFGLWTFLHRKNIAPQIHEKQENNIVSYLKDYQKSLLCCA